jgi:hypothetical protein
VASRAPQTVLSKLLKALIDPNAAPVRSLSREERELMIAANSGGRDPTLQGITNNMEDACGPVPKPTAELARCFLRLANLPNYALDRLSRYEATLWRQAGQILFALDVLDRRRPWDRRRRFRVGSRQELPVYDPEAC